MTSGTLQHKAYSLQHAAVVPAIVLPQTIKQTAVCLLYHSYFSSAFGPSSAFLAARAARFAALPFLPLATSPFAAILA